MGSTGSKGTILYIDDDVGNRLLGRKLLTNAGYTVLEAADGLGGIETARKTKPDLILMDMSLPEMDGYEATTAIKGDETLKDTKVVALTGQSMDGDRERTLAAGCEGYIAKPIDIFSFVASIESYLGGQSEHLNQVDETDYLKEYNRRLVSRLEEKIRELSGVNAQLESRVQNKVQQLHEAQEQLMQSEKMASVGQLAAGVAHEINNPVGYVSSNVKTLDGYVKDLFQLLSAYEELEKKAGDHPLVNKIQSIKADIELDFIKDDLPSLVSECQEGIGRVTQIVKDLKDFSHVDREGWQLVDLHKGLESTLNIVHNELKYKAEVVKDYGDIPKIECLPGKLNQVFLNLLVNAGQAIESGGKIVMRTFPVGESQVAVEIQDNGNGIEPDYLKRLFEPFFTTKPVGEGTGLGLSLSYGIVKDHGGRIDVVSEPGRGARFTVVLPVVQERPEETKG